MNSEEFENLHVQRRTGRTLIVGSRVYKTRTDRRTLYDDVLGVDMLPGPGVDRVIDLEEPLSADLGLFHHVECRSVLEHSRRPWLLAQNIELLMERGGTLHVAVPFVWKFHGYPHDYWRFTTEGVRALFPRIEWAAVSYSHDEPKIPRYRDESNLYLAKTEVFGFGVRR